MKFKKIEISHKDDKEKHPHHDHKKDDKEIKPKSSKFIKYAPNK